MSKAAMELALEALEVAAQDYRDTYSNDLEAYLRLTGSFELVDEAIAALKEAIKQQGAPVAYELALEALEETKSVIRELALVYGNPEPDATLDRVNNAIAALKEAMLSAAPEYKGEKA